MVHITDVLAVAMMLGITAQVKEAGTAWDKGEKKSKDPGQTDTTSSRAGTGWGGGEHSRSCRLSPQGSGRGCWARPAHHPRTLKASGSCHCLFSWPRAYCLLGSSAHWGAFQAQSHLRGQEGRRAGWVFLLLHPIVKPAGSLAAEPSPVP